MKTSAMGFIPLTIQFYLKARSRKKHGEGRWVKQKTGLARKDRER